MSRIRECLTYQRARIEAGYTGTRQLDTDELAEGLTGCASYPPASPQVYRTARPLTDERRVPPSPLAQNIAMQVMQHAPTNKDAQIRLLCDAARDLGFIVRIERVMP